MGLKGVEIELNPLIYSSCTFLLTISSPLLGLVYTWNATMAQLQHCGISSADTT